MQILKRFTLCVFVCVSDANVVSAEYTIPTCKLWRISWQNQWLFSKILSSLTKCTHTHTQSSPIHTSVIDSFANWHLKMGGRRKRRKEEKEITQNLAALLFFFNLAFTRAHSGVMRCCLSCTAGTSAVAVARLCIKCFFSTHAPPATRKSLFFIGAKGVLRSVQLGLTVTKSHDLRVAKRIGLL